MPDIPMCVVNPEVVYPVMASAAGRHSVTLDRWEISVTG